MNKIKVLLVGTLGAALFVNGALANTNDTDPGPAITMNYYPQDSHLLEVNHNQIKPDGDTGLPARVIAITS